MKKTKLAVIGAGYMAEEHIKAFKDIPNLEICGIYSRTKEKAQKIANIYSIPKVYNSISSLQEENKPKLLLVAVSEESLKSLCSEIFKYDWNILIEKPIGLNLKEAQHINEIAKKFKNQSIYPAFNRRHYSSTRSVKEDIESHKGVRIVNILDQEDPKKALKDGGSKKVCENYMYANSVHLIDYFNIFCRGSIKSIHIKLKFNINNPSFHLAYLEFSSGDMGIYQANWNAPGPWSVSISTPEKRWEMLPLEEASFQDLSSRKKNKYSIHKWDKLFKPGLRLQAEEFVKTVFESSASLPTIEDSLKSMELINSIYET